MRRAFVLLSISMFVVLLSRSAPAAEKPKNCVLAGKVIASNGDPLPGIEVRLSYYQRDPHRWTPITTTTSDAAGSYRFEGLASESYGILVEQPGMAPGFREMYVAEDEPQQLHADIKLGEATEVSVSVRDEAGRPVTGARIRGIGVAGPNGEYRVGYATGEWFGAAPSSSGPEGLIHISQMPIGANLDGIVEHDELAPAQFKLQASKGATTDVTLRPGVGLTLRVLPLNDAERLSEVQVDIRHEPFVHPSTMVGPTLPLDHSGSLRVALEPGNYQLVWLKHPQYYVVPQYYGESGKEIRIASGMNDLLEFELRRKVKARGRLIDGVTGEPLKNSSVLGEIANGSAQSRKPDIQPEWAFAAWGETDDNGEYEFELAAGRARLSPSVEGYVPDRDEYEFDVAEDGSTRVPDISLVRLPTVQGVVLGANGEPASNVCVRWRDRLWYCSPVLTDSEGRFELKAPSYPTDEDGTRLHIQPIVAVDPRSPLAARLDVDFTKPETTANVTLTLASSPDGGKLTLLPGEIRSPWSRGEYPEGDRERLESISLKGLPAPALDGVAWFNTEKPQMSLEDYRGRYVLLDFWTTWCGPCHADFPSVRMVQQLFGDRVVVIGVHDNSVPAEAVRDHAVKENLTFPIVCDHPDGRTLAAYEAHGISGYPSYILIDPDGKVIDDDDTMPGPSLRSFKLELIRELLLNREN